jgi:hypothetical protein
MRREQVTHGGQTVTRYDTKIGLATEFNLTEREK